MNNSIRILITGDTYLGVGRVRDAAIEGNATKLFGDFLSLFKGADLRIANLESPLIDEGTPIEKTGPNLKSPVRSINVLKKAGFDLFTLANNHIMDYGSEGLLSTLEACEDEGIETAGAGISLTEAKRLKILDIKGFRLAIVNIAENEFGTTQNGTPGGHPLDPVQNYYTIRKAKEQADKVILIVHGGHEHYELPSPRMVETYRFFADAGADVVVSHHSHCPSGYEVYNGVPILYGLGNFLFDSESTFSGKITPWHIGLIAELTVNKNGVSFELHPFIQNAEEIGLRSLNTSERNEIEEKIEQLNQTIQNGELLAESFDDYCTRVNRMYSSYIEPHSIRILHALRNRNLLPSMLSVRKKKLLLNLTRCEAHRDVLIKTLRQ